MSQVADYYAFMESCCGAIERELERAEYDSH